jgi:hypothetical protein
MSIDKTIQGNIPEKYFFLYLKSEIRITDIQMFYKTNISDQNRPSSFLSKLQDGI